jgi:tRNA/rRNA methyltransferase
MTLRFVLVEPKVPENVGASARAIKTMGFESLVLVNPCSYLYGKSKWLAHGSSDILENAEVYNSLAGALTGSDFAVATSAKQRTVKQDYIPVKDLAGFLSARSESNTNISLVFGREESGLTNDEMKLCDITSCIPMSSPYPSLNLSQAVMVYAYELAGYANTILPEKTATGNADSVRALKSKVREIMLLLGINESDNRYGRIMERVSFLNSSDINLVHTLCALVSDRTGNSAKERKD